MKISSCALTLAATWTDVFASFYILNGFLENKNADFYFVYYLLTSSNSGLNFEGLSLFIVACVVYK